MQRDLVALKPRLDELEASLLECMEASESAESGAAGARSAFAARDAERGSQEAPRRERLALARTELGEMRAVRAASAAAALPGDVRIYERVAAHWRPAVVHLAGGQLAAAATSHSASGRPTRCARVRVSSSAASATAWSCGEPSGPRPLGASPTRDGRRLHRRCLLGNPGPGAWAYRLEWPDGGVEEAAGAEPATTNNREELKAVREALRAVRPPDRE